MAFQFWRRSFLRTLAAAALTGLVCYGGYAKDAVRVNLSATSSEDAIQAALDGLPLGGGEVVLAAGTYEISRPIILRHDSETLRGSGRETILRLADNANCPVIIMGAPMGTSQQATAHIRVADLQIDGNRVKQGVEFWKSASDGSQLNNNGIDVWNVNDSTVERVVCRSCRSGGLVTAVTRRLNVFDFTAYDNQYDGLACYVTEESNFSKLDLHDNLAAGISLDLSFNHNVISNAVLNGNDVGIFMRHASDNTFKELSIDKSRKHGVFMAQAGDSRDGVWQLTPGTECTGNNFDGLTITNSGGDAFLVNNVSCTNNVIKGATFKANGHNALNQPVVDLVKIFELAER